MLNQLKIIVVLPAYNAEHTIIKTIQEIPSIVDEIVIVDDCSTDQTQKIIEGTSIKHFIRHAQNLGYGANQKTCYQKALELGADVIVMLHPDYQYSPKLIPALCAAIAYGEYDVAIGSRILGNGALKGGMPIYKYVFNRVLTFWQNLLIHEKMSEYHSGFRVYRSSVLRAIPFDKNSNDFIFDNQLLCQILKKKFKVCEISCPTRYDAESSSINFTNSVVYGLGVLKVSVLYLLDRLKIYRSSLFQ